MTPNLHDRLKRHTIGDGLDFVMDPKKNCGSWVHDDATGRLVLDCYSQFASQPLGWNHPRLLEAMANVDPSLLAHKIANSDMYTGAYAEFVEEFASIAEDFRHFFFIDGGSLAVENAIKAAFDYKLGKLGIAGDELDFMANRLDVIHLERAFHGRSGYALSLTNTNPDKIWGFPKFPWTRIANPSLRPGNAELGIATAEAAMRKGTAAALIVEPIQGEGGDVHFGKEYLLELRRLCVEYDVLFIVDEVQTGVGLTGKMWAYEHFDLKPDLICFGKKSQVCGIAATDKIDEVSGNVFQKSSRINSTWGGSLIDMIRFTHISRIIKDERLVENAAAVGSYFLDRLSECGRIDNVRGRGLMLAFDLDSPMERDDFCRKVRTNMLVLKSGDRSVRLRPALTFSNDDVDAAVKFIQDA